MPKRIIIADINTNLRKSYEMMVSAHLEDMSLETVSNGRELLENIRNAKYDAIITDDYIGEGITGIEAILEIRKFDKEVPVFMCSRNEVVEQESLAAGATKFINKKDIAEKGIVYFFNQLRISLEK